MSTPKHLGGHYGQTHTDEGALDLLREKGVRSILDLGCGPGGQVKLARTKGLTCIGVDGDPSVSPDILHDFVIGPVAIDDDYQAVWCIEFLEHVDEIYVKNIGPIMESAEVVIITHALPGKRGHHHVNLRCSDYWVGFMAALGHTLDVDLTQELRKRSTMVREFIRTTGMVFRRNRGNFTLESPLPTEI